MVENVKWVVGNGDGRAGNGEYWGKKIRNESVAEYCPILKNCVITIDGI